jgi:hypothetical protein
MPNAIVRGRLFMWISSHAAGGHQYADFQSTRTEFSRGVFGATGESGSLQNCACKRAFLWDSRGTTRIAFSDPSMSSLRGSLQPAHRGYRFQDIATAYFLIRSLIDPLDLVTVDKKLVIGDRIDDLEVTAAGRRTRRQFKSSANTTRALALGDFTNSASTLRIDELVLTHRRFGTSAPNEYRLCATWAHPASGDPLWEFLQPFQGNRSIRGSRSELWMLIPERVWLSKSPLQDLLSATRENETPSTQAEFFGFCERFVIEVSFPNTSESLISPGPLEAALIDELEERVGIGRYPNKGREPVDVAALAIALANLARTQSASLTPAEVVGQLGIRTDYGRVSQSFPLDEAIFHDRPTFRRTLREAALRGEHRFVLAPPGAGKSWELTRLADELRRDGAIVARHYCYLEPGDELVERRVTSDVFFGNLLGDLKEAEPDLFTSEERTYAADTQELEAALVKAIASGRSVALIVDGLDHVLRVRAQSHTLSEDDTDIVERLATIQLPAGVALIIGSQPGDHLSAVRQRWPDGTYYCDLPPWSTDDLTSLARNLGVATALENSGVETKEITSLFHVLSDRADGNPLYARYLSRGLISGLRTGTIEDPELWLNDAPVINSDVAVYYGYLYRTASTHAQAVADILAVIDFAVTEDDLKEMLPPLLSGWLSHAITYLTPVLINVSGQGGVRIFHESFRRFMIEEIVAQGRSISSAIEPVIVWLQRKGFLTDAKCFRFLLPALKRAGRDRDILSFVDSNFVENSVACGHPLAAVRRNLALAANVAALSGDWVALVRIVELHRAVFEAFDPNQKDWELYWATYIEIFSASAAAERLLYDGRPTQPRGLGLLACSLIDDYGTTPPWKEYLELNEDHEGDSIDTFDASGSFTFDERVTLSLIHGRLRTGSRPFRFLRRIGRHLALMTTPIRVLFVRALGARLAREVGSEFVKRLVRWIAARSTDKKQTSVICAVLLGTADELKRVGDLTQAAGVANIAVGYTDSPELRLECILHGASPRADKSFVPDLSSMAIAVEADTHLGNADGVRAWVASVRLVALEGNPRILEAERIRISGVGWYRCWLRYVIELGIAEASIRKIRKGEHVSISRIFDELTKDMHPFAGKPRACDLYSIRRVIVETIAAGLALLKTESDWASVLPVIETVSHKTSSRMDREEGLPIGTSALMRLVMPFAKQTVAARSVRDLVEREVKRRDSSGTYYSTHAEYAMLLARTRQGVGDTTGVREAWERAALYLVGYGWHKDATLYEIMDSVESIGDESRSQAFRALSQLQRLTNAVIAHTDGRTTKYMPGAWFKTMMRVHPASAMMLLAETIQENEGINSWPLKDALRAVVDQVVNDADPALLDDVLSILSFETEYEGSASEDAKRRLSAVVRLKSRGATQAYDAFRRAAAQIQDDGVIYQAGASKELRNTAEKLGFEPPIVASNTTNKNGSSDDRSRASYRNGLISREPAFPPNPSFVDLLAGLRAASRSEDWDSVVLSLSYRLLEMVDAGREEDARRVLRFFARHVRVFASEIHPLSKLAEAFENARCESLATLAYTYAYVYTRGRGGWGSFGDKDSRYLIEGAIRIDPEGVLQVVGNEISYRLRDNWYSFGVNTELITQVPRWDKNVSHASLWYAAYDIIAKRLPLAPDRGWFAPFDPQDISERNVDETLIAIALAGVSDPRLFEKISALTVFFRAVQDRAASVITALRWWLSHEQEISSLSLVLQVLWDAETEPFLISKALRDLLLNQSSASAWAVSRLARKLLLRVQVPPADSPQPPYTTAPPANDDGRSLLEYADRWGLIDLFLDFWPTVTDSIANQLQLVIAKQDDQQKERARERHRMNRGRDGNANPRVPVLLWEHEVFLDALQLEMERDLKSKLWATGQWSEQVEDRILDLVLPSTRVHIALAASRTSRPNWTKPGETLSGESVLATTAAGDPTARDWIRLAWVEREYVQDPASRYAAPTEKVIVFAGATILTRTIMPPNRIPFFQADSLEWFGALDEGGDRDLGWPLMGMAEVDDWLGEALIPTPPTFLLSRLRLTPAQPGKSLSWKNADGESVLAFRTWLVRNEGTLSANTVPLMGADVIANPNFVQSIEELVGAKLRETCVVLRRSLRPQDSAH